MLLKKAGFGDNIINLAKKIDKYYIPTRYTDAWSEGLPEDYYTTEEAEDALVCSEKVISEVDEKWRSLKNAKDNGNR